MKNHINTFNKLLLIDGLFEGGRMFTGATSVAYLLQSGLSLKNIALLKSIQALVVIVAELPTGIMADALGRRLSLFLSIILSIIGFSLFFLGTHLNTFIIAEVLTALALCLWSGAFEAFAIDKVNLSDKTMDEFFHKNSTINSSLVLIFGLLGGWLGAHGLNWPYLGANTSFIENFRNTILVNTKIVTNIHFCS
jgi:MFS family permease